VVKRLVRVLKVSVDRRGGGGFVPCRRTYDGWYTFRLGV